MATKVPKLNLEKFNKKQEDLLKAKYDPAKQVEGMKTRLNASGIDANKALDNRNFVEKALNLTPNQNTLFDIFEVLERPQRALFGAIDAYQKGQNVGEAALAGLTRKNGAQVMFKDIVHNAGVTDSGSSFGLDDVLGLTGEVLADPIDLALIPVTGGGSVAVKAARSLTDANKLLDAAKIAGKASDIAKAEDLVKAAQAGVDAAKTTKRMISPLDLAASGVKKGIGKTFKVADSGITAILQKIDAADLIKVNGANKLGETRKALELAQSYTNFKQRMTAIFSAAKSLPADIWNKAVKTKGAKNLSQAKIGSLGKDLSMQIDEAAKKLGVTSDELGRQIQGAIEYTYYKPKGTLKDIVSSPEQAFGDDVADTLRPIMEKFGYKFDDAYAKVTLDNGVEAYVVQNDAIRKDFVSRINKEESARIELLKQQEKARKAQEQVEDITKVNEIAKARNANAPEAFLDNNLGKNVNGYFDPVTNKIHINPNSTKAVQTVWQHELVHNFAGSTKGNEFVEYALNDLKRTDVYDDLFKKTEAKYAEIMDSLGLVGDARTKYIEEELAAGFAERLFKNADSVKRLVKTNRNLAEKILDFIRDILAKFNGNVNDKRVIEKAEELYSKALGIDSVVKSTDKKFMIIGQSGKLIDVDNLQDAKKLAVEGVNEKDIVNKTGWWKSKDGNWKYRISDAGADISHLINEANVGDPYKFGDIIGGLYKKGWTLGDTLKHDELYKQYPELKNIKINAVDNPNFAAQYNGKTNTININLDLLMPQKYKITLFNKVTDLEEYRDIYKEIIGKLSHSQKHALSTKELNIPLYIREEFDKFIKEGKSNDELLKLAQQRYSTYKNLIDVIRGNLTQHVKELMESEVKETLLHEIQHAVQEIEGFAIGGNPKYAGTVVNHKLGTEFLNSKEYTELDLTNTNSYISAKETYIKKRREELGIPDDYEAYHKLLGEHEARYTEDMLDATEKQLRETGVPSYEKNSIVLDDKGHVTSFKDKKFDLDDEDDLGYHAGDLGKAESYYNMSTSRRSTGHFGTGTYFVGDEKLISDYGYGKRPHEKVDFSKYKLFKPKPNEGETLHDALKVINELPVSFDDMAKFDRTQYIDDIGLSDTAFIKKYGKYGDVQKLKTKSQFKKEWLENDAKWLKNYNEEKAFNSFLESSREVNQLLGFKQSEEELIESVKKQVQRSYESHTAPMTDKEWDYYYKDYVESAKKELVKKIQDNISDYTSDFRSLRHKLDSIFGYENPKVKEALDKVDSVNKIYQTMSHEELRKADSLSTVFMKAMGYEGVDVRGVKGLDNTTYGSVIYDLKGEDLSRKQQIGTARYDLDDNNKLKYSDDIANTFAQEMDMPRFYSDEQRGTYDKLLQNPEFKKVIDYAYNTEKQMLDILDDAFSQISGDTTKFKTNTPEGFIRHATTDEYNTLPPGMEAFPTDFKGSELKGNINTFTGRAYKMSAEEANLIANAQIQSLLENGQLSTQATNFWKQRESIKMFEEEIQKSTADFIAEAPKFGQHVKMLDEVLAGGFLADASIVRGLTSNDKIPSGYRRITTRDLENKLDELSQYLENPESMKKAIKALPNTQYVAIDENVFEMVGRLGSPKELNRFIGFLDATNTLFKKTKLLSPGFQMRNMVGNATNMYLAGVPIIKIFSSYRKADSILKQGDELLARVARGEILTKAEDETYRLYEEFITNGFHEVADELWEIPSDIANKSTAEKKKILKQIMEYNNKINQAADKRFRMALLMYAKEHPDIYLKVGDTSPSQFVRRVLFDANDLSVAEKTIAKRLIPFYTFAKKNLVFQMKNIFENPKKYKNLQKTVRAIWDSQDIDINEIEDYKRQNFWIPIPGLTKDGKYVALKTNLPVGDLAEMMENPLRRTVSSFSPLIRAPFEVAANKQLFSDLPIQEFKGQRGYTIPEVGRKTEYLLSQTGLDVPIATGMDIGRTIVNGANGNLKGQDVANVLSDTFGRSLVSKGDVEQARISRDYEELREVEDLLKYYKQENVDIKTLSEISASQSMKNNPLTSMLNRLKSLNNN